MNGDLSSNAAKANAMKTYDASRASGNTAANGAGNGFGNSSGNSASNGNAVLSAPVQPTQPIQTAPAPVVINNYPGGAGGSGGLFGGGSGPGFFTGLFAGSLLSSHRSEPNYRQNNFDNSDQANGGNGANSGNGGRGGNRYEGQMPGNDRQQNAGQSANRSSFSFVKWLLILGAFGAAVAGAVWFVGRKKGLSQPNPKRYKL